MAKDYSVCIACRGPLGHPTSRRKGFCTACDGRAPKALPAMFDAMRLALRALDAMESEEVAEGRKDGQAHEACEAMRAAIAKVTG